MVYKKAVEQLALLAETWYTSRGIGKNEHSKNISMHAVANIVCTLWQTQN